MSYKIIKICGNFVNLIYCYFHRNNKNLKKNKLRSNIIFKKL